MTSSIHLLESWEGPISSPGGQSSCLGYAAATMCTSSIEPTRRQPGKGGCEGEEPDQVPWPTGNAVAVHLSINQRRRDEERSTEFVEFSLQFVNDSLLTSPLCKLVLSAYVGQLATGNAQLPPSAREFAIFAAVEQIRIE